ncbi:repulsive guidance molecule A [Trichonephila inaurata madagascariensis]|uniref:Repulsive guidance molecule A n=1 Tax=Trichonephila inaurata madagascariensis TaxID=2747483 RepID=A0A8X6Y466_9ARAC|nr:repulsive guidance molecule A [Trichonephila inaurata madagascariensis]
MGRGCSGDPANAPILLQLLIVVCCSSLVCSADCRVQFCSRQYTRATEEGNTAQAPTFRYCSLLRSYAECMRATARSCRGDLSYHTVQSLVMQWMRVYDCENVLAKGPQAMPPPKHPRPGAGNRFQKPPHHDRCGSYRPAGGYSHCALFGDPHLRTFYDELQTCKVEGAWPLLDNPHMAVQVTNGPVDADSPATAITQLTVVIRNHAPCAVEKTYQAQPDFLPGVFMDGSKWSGPGVRIREETPGKHIEINFKYINTRIIIRQSGRYLTFAAKMPSAIAVQGAQGDTLELCVRGCPRKERIDFERLLESKNGPSSDVIAACRALNITDFYFDACVFDLMTTGDGSFSAAARDAMLDAGPHSVLNSSLPVLPRGVESGQESLSCSIVLPILMVWLLLLIRHQGDR